MTLTEVFDLIETIRAVDGDTVHVEAKKAKREVPRRLWETLSAFANTPGGGVIILGLDEEAGFEPVGVEDPRKIQSDLASLCDQMEPPLRPLIEVHLLDGRAVVTVEVPELPVEQKPCHYRGAGMTNGAFVRVADGDRRLTPYEVQVMLASRGQPREDEAPVPEATWEDLDTLLVARCLERLRADEGSPFRAMPDQAVLQTLRVLVPADADSGKWVPSLAGLMALGRYPQRFFPSLGVTFVVYPAGEIGVPGPGGERFLDNRRLDGPVPVLVIKVLDALKRNMKRRAVIRGRFREDIWEYPEDALREALVNALVHRDYSPAARGTPVQVQMFSDRLVIVNPGGLFGPVTVDRLGEAGISAARNQTLIRILEDLPAAGENRTLCENRGSGIGAMLASLRRAGMKPPEFENTIAAFRVIFPNHTLLDEATLAWLADAVPAPIADSQRMALAYVRHNGRITNAEYRRLTGQDSREVSRELRHLVDLGLLSPRGAGRWMSYALDPARAVKAVPESLGQMRFFDVVEGHEGIPQKDVRPRPPDVPPRKRRNRKRDIIDLLAAGGPLSRREIAERLGIGDAGTLKWLNLLLAEGIIETTAPRRSRNLRYRLVP